MIHFSRLGTLTILAGGAICFSLAHANGSEIRFPRGSQDMIFSHSTQGYLGVGLNDVDEERAAALKLKEARGAEIITVDQDAPAFKAGLRVHDVVVQMNGQKIESVAQFTRMLHETPPGRTVSLVAMRDGQTQNITVQLADKTAIAKKIIGGLDEEPSVSTVEPGPVLFVPPSTSGGSGSFMGSFSRNRYYVGIELEKLTSGLAEYFGVHNGTGLLVGNVFPNTPAAVAGLKPADVIQKVNGQPIVSLSDWERAIRLNHGKQVQVTVIRDKREQTVSLVVGEAKNSSELEDLDLEGPDATTLAELRSSLSSIDMGAIADEVNRSMLGIDADALREQTKKAVEAAKSIDQKQIQKAIEDNQKQWQVNRKQIEQQMRELENSLRSLQGDPMY